MASKLALVLGVAAFVATGCGPSLADCDAIAVEQKACMNEDALAACRAANALCEENGGEVLVLESCPLQFACAD